VDKFGRVAGEREEDFGRGIFTFVRDGIERVESEEVEAGT